MSAAVLVVINTKVLRGPVAHQRAPESSRHLRFSLSAHILTQCATHKILKCTCYVLNINYADITVKCICYVLNIKYEDIKMHVLCAKFKV